MARTHDVTRGQSDRRRRVGPKRPHARRRSVRLWLQELLRWIAGPLRSDLGGHQAESLKMIEDQRGSELSLAVGRKRDRPDARVQGKSLQLRQL